MIYEHFGPERMIWGTGYPRPRWELPMDLELQFKDLKVHAGGEVFVRDGDTVPVVVYTGAGPGPQ